MTEKHLLPLARLDAAAGTVTGRQAGEPVVTMVRMVKAAERELAMRRAVYPGRVSAKKMSRAKADEEIAAMEAIVDYLKSNGDAAAYMLAQAARGKAVLAAEQGKER